MVIKINESYPFGIKIGDKIKDTKTGRIGEVVKDGISGNYNIIYVDFGNGKLRRINPLDDAQRFGRYEVVNESKKLKEDTSSNELEFANSIPFDELFDKIKEVTGIDDLKFDLKINETERGVRVTFESQDLSDRVGFLKLIFKEIKISQFNSEVYEEKDGSYSYWCTVRFSYVHPDGGTNGKRFMVAQYRNNEWQYKVE